MPNCLGVYVEKNLIKYAKVSRDKATSLLNVVSYGVKFYENIEETVRAIINETNSAEDELCMNISRENFVEFDVFNKLKSKEIKDLLKTEFETYCNEKGLVASASEMRFTLVRNTNKADSYKAICVSANKAELSTLWQMFEAERLKSLSSMAFSITNILKDKGLGEQAAIVNIEDETTVTVITKGEISKVVTIPIGMQEIISRLADRLNSYSKAYEACKSVTITFDDSSSLSEEQRMVMELLLPTMYDLRERVRNALSEYGSELRKVYLTGTGVLVNNLDLYFGDVLDSQVCEVLKPFFVSKDVNNVKDIIEVNSAIALAMNGLGFRDKDLDFCVGGEIGGEGFQKKLKALKEPETWQKAKDWAIRFAGFRKKSEKKAEKEAAKDNVAAMRPNIEFDENVGSGQIINAQQESEATEDDGFVLAGFDALDKWLLRLAITLGVAFVTYSGLSYYTQSVIEAKTNEVNTNIATANAQIANVETDIDYISNQAIEYKTKTDKLNRILGQIKVRLERSFNLPNFMSQMMFIVPEDVRVTSVQVTTDKQVTIQAQSGKYAQLGYFVSRLKLENALKNVDMEVISMNSDIKIKITGELP
ncbi:MAG: hypothetical protein IJ217_00225 [Clostridia bacterium]|nr:hypothetical protein [Clostridia bacterium]